MFPLRGAGDSDPEVATALLVAPSAIRDDEYEKLDDREAVIANFFLSSCFHLQTFALWSTALNFALFATAMITSGLYESGTFTERYDLRTPVTKTAIAWVPHANVTVASKVWGTTTCDLFDSRDFFGQRDYMQFVTFKYDTLPARYPLTFLLFVGFVFQLATRFSIALYLEPFSVGNSHITGFLERSITFPLFVAVLASKAGVSDLLLLLGIVFSAWSCMLFSFFAEVLFQGDGGFLAIGPGKKREGDTVKRDGGIWVWPDGNIHYHALSLGFALVNFVFVCIGLLHNFYISDACFAGHPGLPVSVQPIKVFVYCTLTLYGLILIGQMFMAYLKPKPSTARREREFLIAEWRKANTYCAADDTMSAKAVEQRKRLAESLNLRVRCAMITEYFNGVLDIMIKAFVISFFFAFVRDV